MTSYALDDLDRRLIDLLGENARSSVSALALDLGVARATVKDRMRRLEECGVIVGYGVKLNQPFLNQSVRAHVLISVETQYGDHVVQELKKLPGIRALYAVSGTYDLIAVLRGESTDDIDNALDVIRRIKGIAQTTSSILLSTKLEKD